ncbi:MAG TPA: hypothetical protein VFW05_00790 [Verrucomicrobiae bacterium]|nr:hypothetical protein [Verrucomicrobiae bacterium]
MNNKPFKNSLIFAIAPSFWGVGFAVVENGTLVDWGMKATKGDKNSAAVAQMEKLIAQYRPSVFVMEDVHGQDSLRSERIRSLAKRLCALAEQAKIKTAAMPRREIRKIFFADGRGSKDALAAMIGERFSEELGRILPPKRKAWMNEHFRMPVFEAVASALAFESFRRQQLL